MRVAALKSVLGGSRSWTSDDVSASPGTGRGPTNPLGLGAGGGGGGRVGGLRFRCVCQKFGTSRSELTVIPEGVWARGHLSMYIGESGRGRKVPPHPFASLHSIMRRAVPRGTGQSTRSCGWFG